MTPKEQVQALLDRLKWTHEQLAWFLDPSPAEFSWLARMCEPPRPVVLPSTALRFQLLDETTAHDGLMRTVALEGPSQLHELLRQFMPSTEETW